jgi:2'-5' RNA ligase
MMKLAVVAYPTLGEADRQWVEAMRAQHDPQARLIGAHFTLVFPTDADPESLAQHVRSVASDAALIPFVARKARAIRDPSEGGGHVFLVPDAGYGELVALHARLYVGPLADRLRLDIPYVPHITVAAHPLFERCVEVAQDLAAENRVVRGRLESLDLVSLGPDTVACLASFALGPVRRSTP